MSALVQELGTRDLSAETEVPMPVFYKGAQVGQYFVDILVEQKVICEIKAVRQLLPEHEAQLLNYLKGTGMEVGLLLNFGWTSVQVKRLALSHR